MAREGLRSDPKAGGKGTKSTTASAATGGRGTTNENQRNQPTAPVAAGGKAVGKTGTGQVSTATPVQTPGKRVAQPPQQRTAKHKRPKNVNPETEITAEQWLEVCKRYGINSTMDKNDKDALEACFRDAFRVNLWKWVKFLPANEAQKNEVFVEILRCLKKDHVRIAQDLDTDAKEEAFINAHRSTMAAVVNRTRTYVQNNLGKKAVAYRADTKDGEFITVEMIYKCGKRQIDLDNPAEFAAFQWYWSVLLPLMAAHKGDWDVAHYQYMTISEGAPADKPGKPYITPSTEAFALVNYKSCYPAWIQQWELKREVGEKLGKYLKLQPGSKGANVDDKGNATTTPAYKTTETHIIYYDAKYFPLYTQNNCGAEEMGGWTNEGKTLYKELRKEIKTIRKTQASKDLEKEFLRRYRENLGITARNITEHRREKRRKAKADREEAEEEFDDDDSDFGGWASGDDDDDDDDYDEAEKLLQVEPGAEGPPDGSIVTI